MSVTVRIPTQLRTLTGGAGEVAVEGASVGEVLKALDAAHAGFGDRLFDDGGNQIAHSWPSFVQLMGCTLAGVAAYVQLWGCTDSQGGPDD